MKKIINNIKNGYSNIMNNTKLGYYLHKTVSTKNAYLLFIIFGSLFMLGAYISYAMFTVAKERNNAFKIIAGNLVSHIESSDLDSDNSVTVLANKSKMVTITITNTNSVKAKYNLNYSVYDSSNTLVNDTVTAKYTEVSKDKPNSSGQYTIDKSTSSSNSKEIQVLLTNNTTTDKKVVFDSQVGLSTATLENKSGVNIVKDEFKYTYDSYTDSISSIKYLDNDTSEAEYKITNSTDDNNSLYVKLSKDSVYMDVTETLDSQDLNVYYKSSYSDGKIYLEHPQSEKSITNDSVDTNIEDYFTFDNQNSSINVDGPISYDSSITNYPFSLVGNIKDQTKTINGDSVTIGYYGTYNDTDSTYDSSKFTAEVIPSFKLYTYDKTSFKSEIEKLKDKIYDYDPSVYDVDGYIKKINNAINNYYNKRKVTQKQLDEVLTELKYGPSMLSIDDFSNGFINYDTGEKEENTTYPNAIYSKMVTLKAGKTYLITNDLIDSASTDTGVRFRIFNTDDTYGVAIDASNIDSNDYASFSLKDGSIYVSKKTEITPKKDIKLCVLYLDKNYVTKTSLYQIK